MTKEELKLTEPDLYNEVFNLGRNESKNFLRENIEKIMDSHKSVFLKLKDIQDFVEGDLKDTMDLIKKFNLTYRRK